MLGVLKRVPWDASDAARSAATEKCLRLLDKGKVDVNETGTDSTTPLWLACAKGLDTVALRLLDTSDVDVDAKNTNTGTTPLYWACVKGLETVALRLLDTGDVDVDAKDTRDGTTPLLATTATATRAAARPRP